MGLIKKIFYGNKISNLLSQGIQQSNDENYFSAIPLFTEVLTVDKYNEKALLERGRALIAVDDYEKALADLERLEQTNPKYDSELYFLLSKIHLALNNFNKAEKYAEKYGEMNDEDFQARYFIARAKYFNKQYDEALTTTDFMLNEGKNDFDLRYLRSLILFAQGNYISSLIEINKAISIDSLNGFSFNLRGLINLQLSNNREAIDDFEYAIRLSPNNSIHYFNKAKTQLKIGDLIEAKKSILKCIELEPQNKSNHLLKAEVELLSDHYLDAVQSYIDASLLDSKDTVLLKRIAALYIYLFDFEGAGKYIQKVLSIEKDDPESYYYAAYIEFKSGNKDEALSYLESAVNIKDDYVDAYLQKGIIEFWSGDYEKSIESFDIILSIDSSLNKVRQYKTRALILLERFTEASDEILNMEESSKGYEALLLESQLNLKNNKFNETEEILSRIIHEETNNESLKLIQNYTMLEQGKFDNISDQNEFQLKGDLQRNAQLLNAVLNFRKDQYHSAKYRFTNIEGLSEDERKELRPFIEYSEKMISTDELEQ